MCNTRTPALFLYSKPQKKRGSAAQKILILQRPLAVLQRKKSESSAPARTLLERLLLHFPDALERSARELEPHYVTTYITELAAAFNSWYASERIIGGSNPESGVILAQAVEQTLSKGLQVLGIPAPEEM